MSPVERRLKSKDPHDRGDDEARFFRGWLKRPLMMGAVSPSSRALGRAMAAFVPKDVLTGPHLTPGSAAEHASMAVLELGPGTGVVTQCLIDRGVSEASLVLVEYSREFCQLLRARFPKAHVVEGDAYRHGADMERALAGRTVGAVVSSLPLFTKSDAEREAVVAGALALMPAGHPFIQFSYALTVPVKPARVAARIEIGSWVKRNLPPARVLVYRRAEQVPAAAMGGEVHETDAQNQSVRATFVRPNGRTAL